MTELDASDGFVPSMYKPASLLPIAKHRQELLYTIETFPVTVLIGQTGSGKTTQLPQFLHEAGWSADGKVIAVTQPRRVAATSVALRVAEEMGCLIGQDVGYSIRFEDVTSSSTRIKFLTDGLLLREALVDPLLTRYSCIMVDEAHERSLSSDILLGILKKIRRKRPDLRIIISSATLQAEHFLRFFAGDSDATTTVDKNNPTTSAVATIFHLSGRMYPVDIHHLAEPTSDYLTSALTTVMSIHTQEPPGDILVFLTGVDEITTLTQRIADESLTLPSHSPHLAPMPLHAGLPTTQQLAIFEPAAPNTRKVVLATNIAEASVTIDQISYVVDCGFVKLRAYNPVTAIDTLTSTPISRASATQRAGRAGRTRPGKCYRLYTSAAHSSLPATTPPEIQRSNLSPVVLQLKALGIDNIVRFDFPTSPPAELLSRALEQLHSLGALDDYAKLTQPLGSRMAELALEPQLSRCLLSAANPAFSCLTEMLSIAAMLTQQGAIWVSHDGEQKALATARRAFAADEGDHMTLLNVFNAFVGKGRRDAQWCHRHRLNHKTLMRAVSVRAQLRRQLERFGIVVADDDNKTQRGPADLSDVVERIRHCLTAGFFAQAARMQPDGTFRAVSGGVVLHAHPSSLMFNRHADWVIFHEAMQTVSKTFIRDVTKIEKAWLLEYAPDFYRLKSSS